MKEGKYIEIEKIKGYENRTLWERKHANSRGQIRRHVTESPAIYLKVKNKSNETINVNFNFLKEDQYGVVGKMVRRKTNLRPNEPLELFIKRKKGQKLRLIDSDIESKSGFFKDTFDIKLPTSSGIKIPSWIISIAMLYFGIGLIDFENYYSIIVLTLLICITGVSLIGRATFTIGMIGALILIPFTSGYFFLKAIVFTLGIVYLYVIWTRRYSISDFLSWTGNGTRVYESK